MCATIAAVITLVSIVAYVWGSHALGGANIVVQILPSPSLPGLSVGILVAILMAGNIHGGSQALSFLVGIPLNWRLYYGVAWMVTSLRKFQRR
jgi:hypothetical protein